MSLIKVVLNSNGFFFFQDGKFFNPQFVDKDYVVLGYQLANSFVQIKEHESTFSIRLMKKNLIKTDNHEWIRNNPYLYCNHTEHLKFGNTKQFPSRIDCQYIKTYQLKIDFSLARELYTGQLAYIYKSQAKSAIELFKEEYQGQFKF